MTTRSSRCGLAPTAGARAPEPPCDLGAAIDEDGADDNGGDAEQQEAASATYHAIFQRRRVAELLEDFDCGRALDAIEALDRAFADPNELRPEAVIRFGCALDFGEVLYGNIGSPARLDFTVLGPAVNLTSRLEALTNEVGETSLISERFAGVTQRETRCLGGFTLKGIAQAQQVVAPPWASDVR